MLRSMVWPLCESSEAAASLATRVAARLRASGVVALPTDTVYGLAVLAQDSGAVKRLYAMKQRAPMKPVAVCVADVWEVSRWADTRGTTADLLHALLPGPVTLLLERSRRLNPLLNADTRLVGVRVPDHDFVRQVARMCGTDSPLALTSANVSGEDSSLAVHEFSELHSQLDAVVDAGPMYHNSRLASTVVDLSVPGTYRVVRPGSAELPTKDILHCHGWQQRL